MLVKNPSFGKIELSPKYRNFDQKSKFHLKIENLSKIEISPKNRNFTKIETLIKNLNFTKRSKL